MAEINILKTSGYPKFLVGATESWDFHERSDEAKENGANFLSLMQEHIPNADYPYLAFFIPYEIDPESFWLKRAESENLGGIMGNLLSRFGDFGKEYDCLFPEGLASFIHDNFTRVPGIWPHENPLTCIVDFLEKPHPHLEKTYSLLETQFRHDVKIIEI